MNFAREQLSDVDAAVEILASAFWHDPLWSWAFSDPDTRADHLAQMWRLVVTHSDGLGHLWVGQGAVAAWLPPGASELSAADEARLPGLLESMVGAEQADRLLRLWADFDRARPDEPHYYLSLLGTHADDRGHGRGMKVLKESIAKYDSDGFACYLESSNPANHDRYASAGFAKIGEIVVGHGVPDVSTMWRPARM